MTAAFNLAQLANNLNTSGQLDATDGLTGLVANSNLASSGTASSSTYLRGDRTWASLSTTGRILQSVQTQYTSTFVTTSNTYVNVFSLSITPSSASNKILLLSSILRTANSFSDGPHYTALRRSTTTLVEQRINNFAGNSDDTANNPFTVAISYLDSPSTTSSITYNISVYSPGSYTTYVNRILNSTVAYGSSTLIALEISA